MVRMKYMMIIDKIVQQIIIQRDGDDSDPAVALTSIDMRSLVSEILGGEKSKDIDEKYKKQLEKSRKLEKEVNTIRDETDKEKGIVIINIVIDTQ